ncbi:TonB-dependent receptor [Polaribacter sp. HaHaR_3_91]|uniref:SusC/RagA family TonB-linked outer membrane protein n=1 Tax=Polaribacter sp. HaHaR_3_91 TaxID=2745561 RepID=UPI001C4FCFEF|nr:TonB-dependent receptor [Polaribacter sp. HaHaR_3_91]QXP63153.1 TonB-dependent receptor [Polaribacter sp. HaHaR_3_91]
MSKHNIIKKLSTCFFLLASLFAFSQQKVTGTVTGGVSEGLLPGVSIQEKGTTNGTSTDFDGNYSLTVSNGDATLVFSYLGFAALEVKVDNRNNINVNLVEDASALDEIIVVGYGTSKKSHLTGSISKIGGEDLASVQVARVDEALTGKLSGVLIQNQSGEPGSDPKIQIRTGSSLSSNSDPLIVVDGFPISGNLATVNPNDIESMEVLKDAASAAIYGSLGANGVILITTKKGKTGKLNFSYNAYTSVSRKYVKDIDMLKTSGEWAKELQTDAYDLTQTDAGLLDYRLWAYENAPDVVSIEDWLFQDGSTTSHDFSVSGGSENIKAFASVGYLNTEGIVKGQGYERFNGRMNIDANLNDKFKAGLSMNGFYGNQDIVPWEMRDLLRAYSISPIYHTQSSIDFVQELDTRRQALADSGFTGNNIGRSFDQDYRGIGLDATSIYDLQPGDVAHDWQYGRNQNGIGGTGDAGVAAKFDNSERTKKTFYGNVSSYLQYEITDGLNIKTIFGADVQDVQLYYYRGILSDGQQRSNQTALDISDIKKSTILSTTTLDYATVIADKHDLSAVVGVELVSTKFKGLESYGSNVPISLPLNYSLFNAEDVVSNRIDEVQARRGIFGRVAYAYDDKYLVSASVRRDGDSRFGANEKYAVFPAVSLGWNVHKEDFLQDNETLSTLKLRFSMGSLGTSSDLDSYSSLSVLGTSSTAFGTGFLIPDEVANADLTWQTNKETNYGVDTGFLDNRLKFSVDYYTSDVNNMLIQQSVSEVLGTDQVRLNRGDITSSGLELELNARIIQNDEFTWSMGANLSTVNSEITSLGAVDELPRQIYGGPSGRGVEFRNYVGGELGEMWGYESAGQVESIYIEDPTRSIGYTSGVQYVVDQNNDGQITYEDDYVKLGSATPDFYWGVSSNMNYKEFDLSFQLQGSQGAELYNIDPIYWQSQFRDATNTAFDANSDGIADNNGKHYLQTRDVHGALIQDASYIALRNLTIGYTLNSDFTSKMGIGSLRLYLAGTNLLYIMGNDYTSFNPEGIETENSNYGGPTTYGYQEGASPIVRSFTFGLNVNF